MNIFHAYDVRGIYPEQLDEKKAERVAWAAASFLIDGGGTLVVGRDGRFSSQPLSESVKRGIARAGLNVIDIGFCSLPLFYYAVQYFGASGGIMVTASHNAIAYNGLKIVGPDAVPIGYGHGLEAIEAIFGEASLPDNQTAGTTIDGSYIRRLYIDFLVRNSGLESGSIPFKIVVDSAGGAVAPLAQELFDRLNIDCTPLFFEIDDHFSRHSPNPLDSSALDVVARHVTMQGAKVGFIFDSDGDRLVVVDEKGSRIDAQYVAALLWQASGSSTDVVHDLRFSKSVREIFGKHSVLSRVGRTNIPELMRARRAEIGAETSGHFSFAEMGCLESSLLAMLKILRFLAQEHKPLSVLVAPFQKYAYSGEINIETKEGTDGQAILDRLQDMYSDGLVTKLDGLTVEYWTDDTETPHDWWFNVRLSNTEPDIRLVVEARQTDVMREKVAELKGMIEAGLRSQK